MASLMDCFFYSIRFWSRYQLFLIRPPCRSVGGRLLFALLFSESTNLITYWSKFRQVKNLFLFQSERLPMAKVYIENGIWTTLLHRLASCLHIQNSTELSVHDLEDVVTKAPPQRMPDWQVLSPTGVIATMQLAVSIFTKVIILPNV